MHETADEVYRHASTLVHDALLQAQSMDEEEVSLFRAVWPGTGTDVNRDPGKHAGRKAAASEAKPKNPDPLPLKSLLAGKAREKKAGANGTSQHALYSLAVPLVGKAQFLAIQAIVQQLRHDLSPLLGSVHIQHDDGDWKRQATQKPIPEGGRQSEQQILSNSL